MKTSVQDLEMSFHGGFRHEEPDCNFFVAESIRYADQNIALPLRQLPSTQRDRRWPPRILADTPDERTVNHATRRTVFGLF